MHTQIFGQKQHSLSKILMENINKKQKNKEMKDTSEDYSTILIDRDTYIGIINLYDI